MGNHPVGKPIWPGFTVNCMASHTEAQGKNGKSGEEVTEKDKRVQTKQGFEGQKIKRMKVN